LELMLDRAEAGEATGPLVDLGSGSGVLSIAAAKLGWGPVHGYDHEQAAIEAARANAAANEVEAQFECADLRQGLPPLAETIVANMTAPVLRAIAARLTSDQGHRGGGPGCLPAVAPGTPTPVPCTAVASEGPAPIPTLWVLSGLLPAEVDELASTFASAGITETERRRDGDWAALLLRR
jgi:ribosomal protein L11 methyltransferase